MALIYPNLLMLLASRPSLIASGLSLVSSCASCVNLPYTVASPTGKYTFEARTKGNAEKYPSKEITTEEITFKLSSVWNGTAFDYSWYKDHSSPYTIETPEQFAAFANIVNHKDGYSDTFAGKTINLTADLDMGNKSFSAIGGHVLGQEFAGIFEGNGHIIKNLNINKLGYDGSNCAALFACVRAATVSNLGLEGVTVEVPI